MNTESNEALARRMADAYAPWTCAATAEQIRRETKARERVADYINAAREQQEDERRALKHKLLSALVAFGVSAIGWAMILALLLVWGAR